MPKNRLEKRKKEYRNFAGKYERLAESNQDNIKKKAVSTASRALTNRLSELDTADENNEKIKLSQAQLSELITLYDNVLKAIHDYTEPFVKRKSELNELFQNNEITQQESNELINIRVNILPQYDRLGKTLSKDLAALKRAKADENSLNQILDNSRINSTYTVKEETNRQSTLGGQNDRLKITLIDQNYEEITGYFTEDHASHLSINDSARAAFNKVKAKYGKAADFLRINDVYTFDSLAKPKQKEKFGGSNCYELFSKDYNEILDELNPPVQEGHPHNFNLHNIVKNPEQFHIFAEAVSAYYTELSRCSNNSKLGISNDTKNNRRNAAMSQMADLLGQPELIAKSENVKITIDGREVKGTFMREAKGSDLTKMTLGSDLLNITDRSFENTAIKKKVADLQILDYLCGNPDRRPFNMLFTTKKDKDGNVSVVDVQGIDNDTCMGDEDFEKYKDFAAMKLDDLRIITKSMAEKVMALKEDDIRQMFQGYDLTTAQVSRMTERLRNLKNKILKDKEFYEKGYAKGTLEERRLKIVDDEELEKLSFYHDLAKKGTINNHFRQTASAVTQADIDTVKTNHLEDYGASVWKLTSGNYEKAQKIMDSITSVDKRFQTGSPQYTTMRNRTQAYVDDLRSFTGPYMEMGNDGKYKISARLTELKKKLDDAQTACTEYHHYKIDRNNIEGKDNRNIAMGLPLTRREKRWVAVENNAAFLKEQYDLLTKIEEKVEEYNGFIREKDNKETELQDIRQKASQKLSREYRAQSEINKFDNYLSQCNYMISDAAKKMKEALQSNNRPEAARQKLLFDIRLGFACAAFPQEVSDKIVENAEKETGKKISKDREELYKTALASYIVKTKLELRSKKKSELTSSEKETLDNLADLKLENNPKLIENIANSAEFKDFRKNMDGAFIGTENGFIMPKGAALEKRISTEQERCIFLVGVQNPRGRITSSSISANYKAAIEGIKEQKKLEQDNMKKSNPKL